MMHDNRISCAMVINAVKWRYEFGILLVHKSSGGYLALLRQVTLLFYPTSLIYDVRVAVAGSACGMPYCKNPNEGDNSHFKNI